MNARIGFALAALLVLAPGLSAGAEDPAPPEAAEGEAALDRLNRVQQALEAKDYATAAQVLDEVFAAGFEHLDPRLRNSALLFATLVAIDREDLLTAHEYSVAATSFPEASEDQWALRASIALEVQDFGDAASALTTLAKQWPAKLAGFTGQTIYSLWTSMGRDPHLAQARLDLVSALFDAKYTAEYGLEPAYLWAQLVAALLDKHQTDLALEVLRHIDDPAVLGRMRVDRRFDALVTATPKSFDIAAVAKARCRQLREVMAKYPRDLQPVIEFMYAQFAVGAFRQNIKLADQILKDVQRAPNDEPPFDEVDSKLNWIYDIKAHSLRALGRWTSSLEVQEKARALRENSSDKVSQAINLGFFFNEHGEPAKALQALDGIDWGRSLSGYGRMQLEHVRLRALLQLGRRDEAETVLSYLRQNQEDAPDTWQLALLDSGDTDGAAALYIARLRDPQQRAEALWAAQIFPSMPTLPTEAQAHSRWSALLARQDVAAAIDEVGRREKMPLYPIE
jgi:hypothetical protein